MSALTGLGTYGRDKTQSYTFCSQPLDVRTATELWQGSDVAAKIVETVPLEMLRRGYEICVEGDNDALDEAVTAKAEDLKLNEALLFALQLNRAHGGAAIILGANDGQTDWAQPLNLATLQSVDWVSTLEIEEITPATRYLDPLGPNYGEIRSYRVTAGDKSLEIHESRLLAFTGIKVSNRYRNMRGRHSWWGESILSRCYGPIKSYSLAWDACALILSDFSVPTLKLKGLAQALAADKNNILKTRIEGAELSRSLARVLLLDSEEEYERKTTNVSGLDGLLHAQAQRLAAAAEMPIALITGESPAGLNATGDMNVRLFYDRIASEQQRTLRPALNKIFRLLLILANGGKEPENWTIKFNPLWEPTELERAQTRFITAQTDEVYIRSGVIAPEVVAVNRFAGDEYSAETRVTEADLTPSTEPTNEGES